MPAKTIKVLIVDDSAIVRSVMTEILQSDAEISIIGTAQDPYFAATIISKEKPDVIILDIEMPRMDGLTFLKKIMSQHPIAVIICSTLVADGCESAMKAMQLGAVDIITKPQVGTKKFLEESRIVICDLIKAASKAKLFKPMDSSQLKKLSADVILSKGNNNSRAMLKTTEKIIAVGASTGGTEALKVFLRDFPLDSPAIAIVQHMPEKFTTSFAMHLNEICNIGVREAKNNDTLVRGLALIAPGGKHMIVKSSGARYYVEVKDGPLVSRHRPSVDVLFRSTSRYVGKNAVGVILTGMGDDGAKGMLEMKEAGSKTIAQDEKTSVVFGMPREAIKIGGVDYILPLPQIARKVINLCQL